MWEEFRIFFKEDSVKPQSLMKTCWSRLTSSPCQGQGLWGGEVPRVSKAQHIYPCLIYTHPGRLTRFTRTPVCDRSPARPGTGGTQRCLVPAGAAGPRTHHTCEHSLALRVPWRLLRVALGSSRARSQLNSPGECWECVLPSPKMQRCRHAGFAGFQEQLQAQ